MSAIDADRRETQADYRGLANTTRANPPGSGGDMYRPTLLTVESSPKCPAKHPANSRGSHQMTRLTYDWFCRLLFPQNSRSLSPLIRRVVGQGALLPICCSAACSTGPIASVKTELVRRLDNQRHPSHSHSAPSVQLIANAWPHLQPHIREAIFTLIDAALPDQHELEGGQS